MVPFSIILVGEFCVTIYRDSFCAKAKPGRNINVAIITAGIQIFFILSVVFSKGVRAVGCVRAYKLRQDRLSSRVLRT